MTSARIAKEIAIDLAKNALASIPGFRRVRGLRPRSATGSITNDYVRRYAFFTLDRVLSPIYSVYGKDVAEVGVGDNLASGFAILANGASSYTAADPYIGNVRSDSARSVYKAVADLWTAERGPLPRGLDARTFPNDRAVVCPQAFERIDGTDRFDLICSVSVIEHVWRLNRFAHATRRLLRPDGVAIHWIDLSAHERWARLGDPKTFLSVPDWLWRTGRVRALPTRLRLHEIIAAFEAASLTVEVLETNDFDDASNEAITSRLAKRFRSMTAAQVNVAGATLRISRTT